MAKGTVICFTGIDGAGKTSHALALMEELKNRGIICTYVWGRWFPGFADPFHFIIRKVSGFTAKTYRFRKPLQIIYQFLILLDYAIPLFFKVKLPATLGRCVIIDRYVYDRLADLYFLGFDLSINAYFVRLFTTMNPKPDIIFLIDVPPETALSRKNDLSFKDAIRYREIYKDLAEIYHFQKMLNLNFCEARNQILNKSLEILRHHSGFCLHSQPSKVVSS
jgi:dTMP kinase